MTNLYPTGAPLLTPASPSADLRISEVNVSNFRSIVDIRIPLEPGATFLVGENNAGKSSFLLAIAVACGFHRATRDDLHQSDKGTSTEATIDLIIRSAGEEFNEAVAQRLNGNFGYNAVRPHNALGNRTPEEFAQQVARNTPVGL